MRVLETGPQNPLMMVKKKQKLRNKTVGENLCDSSDETDEACGPDTTCSHYHKAVNENAVRKALKHPSCELGTCGACSSSKSSKKDTDEVVDDTDEIFDCIETTIWLCLQCGHQGCGRNSKNKHSLHHYKTPHSTSHAVVVNLDTWVIWCYECDDEINPISIRRLSDLLDFIRKQFTLPKNDVGHSQKNKTTRGEIASVNQNDLLTKNKDEKSSVQQKPLPPNLPKVKGLSNLGNTCFFNAILQNMCQTHLLKMLLSQSILNGHKFELPGKDFESEDSESNSDKEEKSNQKNVLEPITLQLSEGNGNLTGALEQSLNALCDPSGSAIYTPNSLFTQVCKKSPRFKGFQQQDSHELLRTLLDGIRLEETKRLQAGILQYFGYNGPVKPSNVDADMKSKIKGYGSIAKKQTLVDNIFGGYLISTIFCNECNTPSTIFEPFLDLSLPVYEEKQTRTKKKDKEEKDFVNESLVMTKKEVDDDLLSYGSKTSKSKSKKAKQQMRKDKKRGKKALKSLDHLRPPSGDSAEGTTTKDKEDENADEGSNKDQRSNDENGSISDADVEDNEESDASRRIAMMPEPPSEVITRTVDEEGENLDNLDDQDVNELTNDMDILKIDESKGGTEINNEIPGDSTNNAKDKLESDLRREAVMKAMSTLGPKYHSHSQECSVLSCLSQFTTAELLTGNNKFGCSTCTKRKYIDAGKQDKKERVYCNASKQYLVYSPPPVLTLHLKRFQQVGFSLRKVNRHVEFPVVLDLAPFSSALSQGVKNGQNKLLYSLYGVVEHSGRLNGGHYMAYVKVRAKTNISHKFLQKTVPADLTVRNLVKLVQEIKKEVAESEPDVEDALPGRWYHISDSMVREVQESAVLHCQAYILFYERIY